MPRLRANQVPSYRLHKQSGQAIVTLNGRDFTLGLYDSAPSRKEYQRLIGEWLANGRQLPAEQSSGLIVLELVERYLDFARTYYRNPDGSETSEIGCIVRLIQLLDQTHGGVLAVNFGPLALEAVRNEMIRLGWVRKSINRHTDRIKRMFKWGVSREIIPSGVYEALRALPGLKRGRCHATEADPVRPVPEATIAQTLPYLSRHVKAMVQVQLLTGMRPGELCNMRWCDINRTGKVWIYTPFSHKTQHFGHQRKIAIGPKAQAILKEFLKMDQQRYAFCAADAVSEMYAQRLAQRKTPLHLGNGVGTNRKSSPKRSPGASYTIAAYRRAITRACELAFPLPPELAQIKRGKHTAEQRAQISRWQKANFWHPHQLRHNAATRIASEYGITDAQVILGHQHLNTTEIYAERDLRRALSLMERCG